MLSIKFTRTNADVTINSSIKLDYLLCIIDFKRSIPTAQLGLNPKFDC
jgi:hypothetical protein